MMRYLLLMLTFLISGCTMKEEYVTEDRVLGLYKRDCYEEEEFLCVKADHTYEYFIKSGSGSKVLSKGKWDFTLMNGKSIFGLDSFNYSMPLKKYLKSSGGHSMPVKYSHKRKAVLLRMDADEYSKDFVKIDSTSCEAKSPE